jgi:bacteriocin-like protein
MKKDKLPQDEEISNEDLEQVSGGIGTINLNLNVFKTAYKEAPVATNFLKIDTLAKK